MRCLTEQEVRDRYYQDGIEDGKKEGYEKGVRDMWEETRKICRYGKGYKLCSRTYDELVECISETCPIAEKLLKAVK